ncbi:LysM peptidoglycan-binding domain-containing protein [uncultured Fibrella sp.]|uniref:LysM peptidoglycan-binding domain-containing protein n=1 Tax=uncultured Fibrella sp. TaxID=1284596 RepID=UPI0035CC5C68
MPETPNNERQKASTSLPLITLLVLVGLIAALLYIGYDSLADDTGNARELTSVPLDTTDQAMAGQNDNPENILPDTSTTPAPVDLSQAPAPTDEDVADKPTEKTSNEATDADKPVKEEEKPEDKPEKKPETPKVNGSNSTYTIGDGETFYGVASRLNMKVSTLKALNPDVDESSVKSGVTKLRVKVKAIHTVGKGDVLRVVADKYGVSKEALMKANHKTKDIATRGEKLIIPLSSKE